METLPQLQLSEFQRALTPQRLLVSKVIAFALFMGVTLFLGIVLFLYTRNEAAETPEDSLLSLLSLAHGVSFVVFTFIANSMYRMFVTPKGLNKPAEPPEGISPGEFTPELRCQMRIFMGFVLRSAIMEGMAMFGVIICLLGVMEGQIHLQPVYWLNLLSYIFFVMVMLWTFPTKERLERIFQERFLQTDFRV